MRDPLNVAVIGAGYWGKKVIEEYLQLTRSSPKINFSMACDLQDENLRYCKEVFATPFGISVTRDYGEVLSSSDIDAVHICTPNETHYKICKEALSADKHVLLEKPMTLRARHAYELIDIAESRNLCLQVGHIFRFNNAVKKMRELIAQDYFGDLYYMKLQWTTLTPSPVNRDIIFDLGPHPIDILDYLLERMPTKVGCKARAFRKKSLEVAYLMAEFDGDLMAHIELSWLQPGKERRMTVIGSERSATVDCLKQTIGIYENGHGTGFDFKVVRNNTIRDEIRHFVKCILGEANFKNNGLVGARNVEILEGLKRSIETGRTVKIEGKTVKIGLQS